MHTSYKHLVNRLQSWCKLYILSSIMLMLDSQVDNGMPSNS